MTHFDWDKLRLKKLIEKDQGVVCDRHIAEDDDEYEEFEVCDFCGFRFKNIKRHLKEAHNKK